MLLKDLLNIMISDDHHSCYTPKCDLWNADNIHEDIITNVPMDEIPEIFLNCKVEANQGLLAKEKNHFIISIHTK